MTAEVAILNREAVAIAADSAVTLTGLGGRKIYNTANKLFALSTTEPVAVMIYNGSSFGSIPWDTVVKEYRRELALKSYATIEEYAHNFIEYLSSLVGQVSTEEQRMRIIMTAKRELSMVRGSVQNIVDQVTSAGKYLDEVEICSLISDCIKNRIDELNRGVFVEGISASVAGKCISAVYKDWASFVDQSLDGLPTNTEIKRLARVMARTSLRVASPSPDFSGVVVVGFGKDQWFPAMSHYWVDGVIAQKVRYRHVKSVHIGDMQPMGIYPFAQDDMVVTFMDGIHPVYRALGGFVAERIDLLIERFAHHIKGTLSPNAYTDLLNEMERGRSDTVNDFIVLHDDLKRSNYEPVTSVVASLPKEELAEMAEALVNLTSFKRRVSTDAETVGGPIDVVVISKGDGLVWIKRKHYFSPELNHRYFYRDQRFNDIDNTRKEPA